ncbi:M23 family metallopeptidase [Pseudonocardia sp. K10HN5]|uniref:M23 family metallopeptidase n=2 Tax=Pseudonocardia acidicola TaxID=2724939 RepID=A0ABX1S5D7_9PSEU|nr:M23 family metallopeptidase [Pseudonocardia acidicola]
MRPARIAAALFAGIALGIGWAGTGVAAGAATPPAAVTGPVATEPVIVGPVLLGPIDAGAVAEGPPAPAPRQHVPPGARPPQPSRGPGEPGPVPGRPGPARPPGAGALAPGAAYAWPLHPLPVVRSPFHEPTHRYGPGHRGVDLAGVPGQPVLAARDGTVVFAGPVAGRGVVSVQHADGLRTTYEPITPTVTTGTVVARGERLGTLAPGHPGCPDPACLHWGVRRSTAEYLDPLVLLRPARVRLLPVPDPWPGGTR